MKARRTRQGRSLLTRDTITPEQWQAEKKQAREAAAAVDRWFLDATEEAEKKGIEGIVPLLDLWLNEGHPDFDDNAVRAYYRLTPDACTRRLRPILRLVKKLNLRLKAGKQDVLIKQYDRYVSALLPMAGAIDQCGDDKLRAPCFPFFQTFKQGLREFRDRIAEVAESLQRTEFSDDALLSPRKIANLFGLPYERTRKRLERLRGEDSNCFVEIENRRRNEPRFHYHYGAVRSVIEALRMSSNTSSEK